MGLNICDRCVSDCRHERNPNEIVVKCGAFKAPQTNADRIRSMSDEELAEYLEYPICKYSKCAEVCPVFPENKDKSCKENILNYLRQPAEEVRNEQIDY